MALQADSVYGCVFCEEIDASFQCQICLGVMSRPVTLHCGHSGCLKCFEQLATTSPALKCPVCRMRMPDRLTVNVCLNALTRKLAMKCQNAECSWSGGYGEAEAHGAQCAKAVIHCSNAGCGVAARREDMADHERTCPKKAMPCLKCHKPVVRENSKEHEEGGCFFSVVECPLACGVRFPRCHVHVHLQSCEQKMFECNVRGCKAVKRLREREKHDHDAATTHKRLQAAEIQRLRRTIFEKTSHREEVGLKEARIVSFKWEVPHFKETIRNERRRPEYKPLTSADSRGAEGLRMRGLIDYKEDYHLYVQVVAAVNPIAAEVRFVLKPGEPGESLFSVKRSTIEAGKSVGRTVELENFLSADGQLRIEFTVIVFNLIAV